MTKNAAEQTDLVSIPVDRVHLAGNLAIPSEASGVVPFARQRQQVPPPDRRHGGDAQKPTPEEVAEIPEAIGTLEPRHGHQRWRLIGTARCLWGPEVATTG